MCVTHMDRDCAGGHLQRVEDRELEVLAERLLLASLGDVHRNNQKPVCAVAIAVTPDEK